MFRKGDLVEVLNPPVHDPLRHGFVILEFKPMFFKLGQRHDSMRYRVEIQPDYYRVYDPWEIDFITVVPCEI